MSRPVAALTGGTGFLGSYCAAALDRAGWQVRLLTRAAPLHPMLSGIALELVLGDLDDEPALSRLVRGAGAIVHAAGLVKACRARTMWRVNRDGTARLAAIAAREAPGVRVVMVSSQAARAPDLSVYAASKHAAERAAAEALGGACTILRPGVIYGPWDAEGAALLRLAAGRTVPVPTAPEPRLAMIHARDAAECIAAMCARAPDGAIYEICDGDLEGHAWRDLISLARPPGAPPARFLTLPDAAIKTAAAAGAAMGCLRGRAAIFGRGKAREFLHRDWRPAASQQPPSSLWTPAMTLAAGMAETRAWWQAQRSRRDQGS